MKGKMVWEVIILSETFSNEHREFCVVADGIVQAAQKGMALIIKETEKNEPRFKPYCSAVTLLCTIDA